MVVSAFLTRLIAKKISLRSKDESGLALLMTVFVLALASILVMDFSYRMRFDTRTSRAYCESIQAEYILKSTLNFARLLLELPKLDGINEDWLGEPWALIGSAPTLPISDFQGNTRLIIVDEEGKIDINSIADPPTPNPNPHGGSLVEATNPQAQEKANPLQESSLFWKNSVREIFIAAGFISESYDPEQYRTLGNLAYEAGQQVAIIHDWIDPDDTSYSNISFDGEGIESSSNSDMFFDRPLKSLTELQLVPGMTAERVRRIAPFIRVSDQPSAIIRRINVNTAPYEVLIAVGFSESQAAELAQQRLNLPITKDILYPLVLGDPLLAKHTKVTSSEFSVISRVAMPNVTKWLHAIVSVHGTQQRGTRVKSVKYY